MFISNEYYLSEWEAWIICAEIIETCPPLDIYWAIHDLYHIGRISEEQKVTMEEKIIAAGEHDKEKMDAWPRNDFGRFKRRKLCYRFAHECVGEPVSCPV